MKIRTILFSLLGIVIFLIAAGVFTFGAKRWRVSRKLAAIQNSGSPVSFNELLAAQPPTSDNDAAAHLKPISESANQLFAELEPILYPESGFDWQTELGDAERSKIDAIYSKFPKVLPAWKRATESSYCRWSIRSPSPMIFQQDVLSAIGDVRLHNRLAVCRAEYLVADGRADEAVLVCLSQFQLLDLQDSGFGLVHFLTMAACRGEMVRTLDAIVRNHSLSDDTHAAIENTLAGQDVLPGFTHGLETERVVGIESFETMPITIRWFAGGLGDYLNVMESEIAKGGQSAWQLPQESYSIAPGLTASVLPAINSAREAMNRLRGELRRLRMLNAMVKQGITLEEMPLTESDRNQLGLPTAAMIDPLSGRPIYQPEVPDSPL